jgi:hypothetical protein
MVVMSEPIHHDFRANLSKGLVAATPSQRGLGEPSVRLTAAFGSTCLPYGKFSVDVLLSEEEVDPQVLCRPPFGGDTGSTGGDQGEWRL